MYDISYITYTLGASPHRVFTVCLSMDEQFADAGNASALRHPTVGHLSGKILMINYSDVNRGSKNRNSLQFRVLEIEFLNSKLDFIFCISA